MNIILSAKESERTYIVKGKPLELESMTGTEKAFKESSLADQQ
jgi:hypothetical protein